MSSVAYNTAAAASSTAFVPRATCTSRVRRCPFSIQAASSSKLGILGLRGGAIEDNESIGGGGNDYLDLDEQENQSIVDNKQSDIDATSSTRAPRGSAESLIHEFESELVKIRRQIELEAEQDLLAWRAKMLEKRRRREETRLRENARVASVPVDDEMEVEDYREVSLSDAEGTQGSQSMPIGISEDEYESQESGSSDQDESGQEAPPDFQISFDSSGDSSSEQTNTAATDEDALDRYDGTPQTPEQESASEMSDSDEITADVGIVEGDNVMLEMEDSSTDHELGYSHSGEEVDVTYNGDISAPKEDSSPSEYGNIGNAYSDTGIAVEDDIKIEESPVGQEVDDDIFRNEASSADSGRYDSDEAVPAREDEPAVSDGISLRQIDEDDVTVASALNVDNEEVESDVPNEPVHEEPTRKRKPKTKRKKRRKKKGARITEGSDVPSSPSVAHDGKSLSVHAGAGTTKKVAVTASRRIVYYCIILAIISSIRFALAALMKWAVE